MTAGASGERMVLSLGEWAVVDRPEAVLTCLGLGSCVALCAWDTGLAVAGMAHMVLPDSSAAPAGRGGASAGKFVDCAIPLVISEMERNGARRSRLRVALVGGARMLRSADGGSQVTIGARNVAAARLALRAMGLGVFAEDVGGDQGRTVTLEVGSGAIQVRTAQGTRAIA